MHVLVRRVLVDCISLTDKQTVPKASMLRAAERMLGVRGFVRLFDIDRAISLGNVRPNGSRARKK